MGITFDDLDSTGGYYQRPKEALWTLNLKDKENQEVLLWCKAELNYLKNEYKDIHERMRRNLALYKGIQYATQETRGDFRDQTEDKSRLNQKMVINHLHDLANSRASKLIKYKPYYSILPSNDEVSDKAAAKMAKLIVDNIWYVNKFDALSLKMAQHAGVLGETYLFVNYNKNKGAVSKAYKDALKITEKIHLLDNQGNPVTDDKGKEVIIRKPVKTGEVEYKIKLACEIFPARADSWEETDYLFTEEVMPIDKVRLLYPKSYRAIVEHHETQIYDYSKMLMRPLSNEVIVKTLWWKKCDYFDEGRKIVFTDEGILESIPFPYEHEFLPFVRFTDIDLPGENRGWSFFELVKALTSTYNNLNNMVLRNQLMVSHPKWMIQQGMVNPVHLTNDITIVPYKGVTPPQLVQANPTPAELFAYIKEIKTEFSQLAGIFGQSRGEPPPGITAGVALQFLDEQEQERFNEPVAKWGEVIKEVVQQTVAVAASFYDESDGRTIKVLGKDNQWLTEVVDIEALTFSYDVRINNASALPNSRAAKTQSLLDMNKQFPLAMPAERVLDLLELGQAEKFSSIASVSVKTAEAENEYLAQPEQKFDVMPDEFEDLITHWNIHIQYMQSFDFKYTLDDEAKERFKKHIIATEYLMFEKAQKNQLFAQGLQQLKLYPVLFGPLIVETPQPAQSAPQPQAPQAQQPGEMSQGMPQEQGQPTQEAGMPQVAEAVGPLQA